VQVASIVAAQLLRIRESCGLRGNYGGPKPKRDELQGGLAHSGGFLGSFISLISGESGMRGEPKKRRHVHRKGGAMRQTLKTFRHSSKVDRAMKSVLGLTGDEKAGEFWVFGIS